jgi:hypothetical protein
MSAGAERAFILAGAFVAAVFRFGKRNGKGRRISYGDLA